MPFIIDDAALNPLDSNPTQSTKPAPFIARPITRDQPSHKSRTRWRTGKFQVEKSNRESGPKHTTVKVASEPAVALRCIRVLFFAVQRRFSLLSSPPLRHTTRSPLDLFSQANPTNHNGSRRYSASHHRHHLPAVDRVVEGWLHLLLAVEHRLDVAGLDSWCVALDLDRHLDLDLANLLRRVCVRSSGILHAWWIVCTRQAPRRVVVVHKH